MHNRNVIFRKLTSIAPPPPKKGTKPTPIFFQSFTSLYILCIIRMVQKATLRSDIWITQDEMISH